MGDRTFTRLFLTFFILFGSLSQVLASHLMGGTVTYKYIGNNKYAVAFYLYRDCSSTTNPALPSSLPYYLWGISTKKNVSPGRTAYPTTSVQSISGVTSTCGSYYCTQRQIYYDTFTEGTDTSGYYVYYYSSARNKAIQNLNLSISGGQVVTGITLYNNIPPRGITASSPQILKDMTPNVCENKTNIFNAGFYSPNSDSMVFSFVNPVDAMSGGGSGTKSPPNWPQIGFASGYSLYYPFGTSYTKIVMDSTTGVITAEPGTTGIYVVTVQIQDYQVNPLTHKGTLMNTTRVDLEFVSVNCGSTAPPKWGIDSTYKRTINVGQSLCFEVRAYDTTKSAVHYDTLTMTASGDMLGSNSSFPKPWATFSQPDVMYEYDSAQFCWTPSCPDITYSTPHTVTFEVQDQHCNTITKTWSIYVKPLAFVKAPVMRAISITGPKSIQLNWDTIKTDTNFLEYNIYREYLGSAKKSFTLVKTIPKASVNSWIDTNAINAQDTSYKYYIVSVNKCSAEGYSSDTFQSVIISNKPATFGGLEFDWNAISYTYRDSFAIYLDTGAGPQLLGTTIGLSYVIPLCHVKVKSIQVKGLSKYSIYPSASNFLYNFILLDTTPPTPAPVLYATAASWTEADILFTKSASPDANHYVIYRSTNGGAFVPIDSVNTTSTGTTILYKDKTANTNTNRYCYDITGVDNCGNRKSYNQPHCMMLAKVKPQQKAMHLSWTTYSGFTADTVKVQEYENGKWITRKIDKATDTAWTDTGITCVKRTYRLLAYNDASKQYSVSDSVSGTPNDTVTPSSPAYILVSFDPSKLTQINESFKTVGAKDIAGYKLYSWTNDTLGSVPTSVTTSVYPDTLKTTTTVSANKLYCFDQVTVDSCGNVSRSHPYCAIQLKGTALSLSAKLVWSNYVQTGLSKYVVQESTTSGSWGNIDSTAKLDTTDLISYLNCRTAYSFRIRASLSGGVYVYSNTVVITPIDTVKPQQVYIEDVTVVNTSSNKITFDQVTDPTVNKYLVYGAKDNGAYSLLTTINSPASSPVTYTQSGINTTTDSFFYKVYAVDSCASNISPTSQVHSPVLLRGVAGEFSAKLTWSQYKGFAVKNYIIQYYNSGWNTLATVAANVTTYTDQPIPCLKKYYRIQVVPQSGSVVTVSDSISVTPYNNINPSAPVLLSASVTGYHSILVSWQKSTSTFVNQYAIYRQAPGATSLSLYKVVNNVSSFTDNNVNTDSGVVYCYAVRAIDSCAGLNSVNSSTDCVINLKADSNICYQKIYISWTSYSGWAAGVSKYLLYRKVESTGTDSLIATLPATTFSFIDSTMSNTKSYCYRIVAQQSGGTNTSSSNYSCSKIYQIVVPQIYSASKISTDPANGTVVVKWKSLAGQRFYKYYQLYYKPATGSTYTLLQNNIPIATDSFVHTGLNTKTLDHDYYLVVIDSCGNRSANSSVHQTMILTITIGQLIHHLSWTPYQGFNIKGYVVERYQGGKYVNIDTVPGNKTTDVEFPAPCNYHIYYRIAAIDSFGHYAWSDTMGKKAIDTIPSNAPTFVNATVISSSQVKINFLGADSASTYDYVIQRRTNGVWSTAGHVLFSTKHAPAQFIDVVNTTKDQHCYTIITEDSCLNATPSDTFCTITLTGKALDEANQLYWTKFSGYKLASYQVQDYLNGAWHTMSTLPVNDTALMHDSIHCYIPQYYRILGTEAAGGSNRTTLSDSMELTPKDTIAPPASTLKYASVLPNGNVKLLWTYTVRSNAKYTQVYRKINSGAYTSIATLTFDSTYVDNGVNPEKDTLSYYVVLIDSCNAALVSPPSDTAHVVHMKLNSGGCVPTNNLFWTAYANLPGGTTSYTIMRSTSGGPFTNLTTVSKSALSYRDAAVVQGVRYTYKIIANSATSILTSSSDTFPIINAIYPNADTARLVFAGIIASDATNGSVYLQWQADPAGDTVAAGYRIYMKDTTTTGAWKVIYQSNIMTDTSYLATGLNTLYNKYRFKFVVFNKCDLDGPSGKDYYEPVYLTLQEINNGTTSASNVSSLLSWNTYKGTIVSSYSVFRFDNKGVSHNLAVKTAKDSTYLDTSIVCQHHYIYQIIAHLSNGLNSYSDSIGITAFDTVPPAKSKLYVISVDSTLTTGGKISMRFSGNDKTSRSGFNIYRSVNGGPFTLYDYLNSKVTDTVYWQDQGANTINNTYAYYISALDSCGNHALGGDTDQTSHLAVHAVSQYNQLNWTPYSGFKNWSYVIEKRTLLTSWQALTGVTGNTVSYRDSNIRCHVYYMYRIRYVDKNSPLFGFSNIAGDTAVDTVAPKVSQIINATVLTTGSGNGIVQVNWNASPSADTYGYLVYRSSDGIAWTLSHKLITGLTFADSNLYTADQPYYYRITPEDTCGNIGRTYAATHETIHLRTQGGNRLIQLFWNSYVGWTVKNYLIYRDGVLYTTVSGTTNSYTDTMTTCNRYYHYMVEAIDGSPTPVTSYSNTDSLKTYNHVPPAKVYLRSASIDVAAGQVVVSWDSSATFDVKNYYVYRKRANDGQMVLVDSTSGTYYNEPLSDISGADCYYVFARDACGNQSDASNRACLIILQGANQKDQNVLKWNAYADWPDGIKGYTIYKNEDNLGWTQINSVADTTTYTDKSLTSDVIDYCYQVEAVENTGTHNATSTSNIVCLHQDPYVFIPDAFTPTTSPGLNDSFGPKGMFIKSYQMDIYNRWGEKVYHTDNSVKWDGTAGGSPAPGGIYMYMIKIEGYNHNYFSYKGNLIVIQ